MPLSRQEVVRRLVAARELRGVHQDELGRLFRLDGLGSSNPREIERGNIPMRAKHIAAAARHLRVPEEWFTADDVTDLMLPPVPAAAPAPAEPVGRDLALERVAQVGARNQELLTTLLGEVRSLLEAVSDDLELRAIQDALRPADAEPQAPGSERPATGEGPDATDLLGRGPLARGLGRL